MRDHSGGGAYDRNEDLKTPKGEGKPPRPATEPLHDEHTSGRSPTATDPATGEPNPSP